MESGFTYLSTMFSTENYNFSSTIYYIRQYLPEIILSIIGIFPLKNIINSYFEKNKDNEKIYITSIIAPKVYALIVFVLSYIVLISDGFNPFIYFQF